MVNPLCYRINYFWNWFIVLLYNLSNKSFRNNSRCPNRIIFKSDKLYIKWRDTPILEFGIISHNIEPAYFIEVKKKKGKGYAKNCEGKINIEDIDTHTVWARSEFIRTDIGDKEPLRLFSIDKHNNTIDFPSGHNMQGRSKNRKTIG